MSWFHKFCRNVGLMVHNVRHPDERKQHRRVVSKDVEEQKRGNVTLRRTTIEEIEFEAERKGD